MMKGTHAEEGYCLINISSGYVVNSCMSVTDRKSNDILNRVECYGMKKDNKASLAPPAELFSYNKL